MESPDQSISSEARPGTIHRSDSEFVGVAQENGASHLVAVRSITTGTRIFRIEGEQTRQPTRYSLQIDEDLHIELNGTHSSEEILVRYFWRFMNHSCEPNTVIRDLEVVACRDIGPGEAVTFNYNTTEFDMAEPFACHCGSATCLGTIRGFKHLTAHERERLRTMLAPYLARLLGRRC